MHRHLTSDMLNIHSLDDITGYSFAIPSEKCIITQPYSSTRSTRINSLGFYVSGHQSNCGLHSCPSRLIYEVTDKALITWCNDNHLKFNTSKSNELTGNYSASNIDAAKKLWILKHTSSTGQRGKKYYGSHSRTSQSHLYDTISLVFISCVIADLRHYCCQYRLPSSPHSCRWGRSDIAGSHSVCPNPCTAEKHQTASSLSGHTTQGSQKVKICVLTQREESTFFLHFTIYLSLWKYFA